MSFLNTPTQTKNVDCYLLDHNACGKESHINQPDFKRPQLPPFAGYYLLIIQSRTQSLLITQRITEGVVFTGCEHQ